LINAGPGMIIGIAGDASGMLCIFVMMERFF